MFIKVCDRNVKIQGKWLRTASIDGDGYRFMDDPRPIIEGLRNSGTRVDIFTFLPKLPGTNLSYSYPMEMDNYAVLPISTFDQWWNKQIGFKARNKAKQAGKKGIVVREVPFDDRLVAGITEIYNECPVRQGRVFWHYGKNHEAVYKVSATFLECSAFIGAYDGDKLIGFIKLTFDETGKQAGIMHIISRLDSRDKAPTNALVAEAVRVAADRGASYLVYANWIYGNRTESSLRDFKERNAFERMDVPRYYVPLSPLGSMAFKLRLHHNLVERVPEPVAAKLRDLRSAWLQRRFHLRPEMLSGS
jgi:hypothetical protein